MDNSKRNYRNAIQLTLLVKDDAERCELSDQADIMDCGVSVQLSYRSDAYWLFGRNISPNLQPQKKYKKKNKQLDK